MFKDLELERDLKLAFPIHLKYVYSCANKLERKLDRVPYA